MNNRHLLRQLYCAAALVVAAISAPLWADDFHDIRAAVDDAERSTHAQLETLQAEIERLERMVELRELAIDRLNAKIARLETALEDCLNPPQEPALLMGSWLTGDDRAYALEQGWGYAPTLFHVAADPDGDKTIDEESVLAWIERTMPEADSTARVVIDLEKGYDDADRIAAIKLIKRERPNVTCGCWGYPAVKRIVDDPEWPSGRACLHIAHEAAIEKAKEAAIDEHADLWPHVDFIVPCIYDAALNSRGRGWQEWQQAVVKARVEAAVEVAQGRPVLACMSHTVQDVPYYHTPLSLEEIESDQIAPALAAGADGFLWWNWAQRVGTERDAADLVLRLLGETPR